MRTYFVEIAVIKSAAKALGMELTANYAELGALEIFRDRTLGEVEVIPGIEDMKERAESFRFGTLCGRVIEKYMNKFSTKEISACEAGCFREFVTPDITENQSVNTEQKKITVKTVIEAFVKRAQIRTHTAKPGFENINIWLDRYNDMQVAYREEIDAFIEMVVEPQKEEKQLMDAFLKVEFHQIIQEIVQEYRKREA